MSVEERKAIGQHYPDDCRIAVYDSKACAQSRTARLDELPGLLTSDNAVIWVDLIGPHADDARLMDEVFNFHHLAIEDTRNQRQRPKVEEYPGYMFGILNSVARNGQDVDFREIDVFVGHNYVVSVHPEPEPVIDEARHRADEFCLLAPMSAGYVLYVLVDTIVDSYFPILDDIGDEIEDIGDRIFEAPRREFMERLFRLKRTLGEMWRVAGQQRDMFSVLMRENSTLVNEPSLRFYFRDVYDHLLRITDTINTFRDTLTNVVDLYVSGVSNRLNQQVNRLTIITIGIGILSVITGFYGMNFERTWPPFETPWGVLVVLALIALVVIGVVLVVRQSRRL